jgi:hypothetical protein
MMEGQASQCTGTEQPPSRLLLQQVSDNSAIIQWRGEANSVCLGEKANKLSMRVEAVEEANHKIARVTGLKPDTRYFYSLGGSGNAPQGQYFSTAPKTGQLPADGNSRIWLIGDSGTASVKDSKTGKSKYPWQAKAVKDGALKFISEQGGNEPIDALILLGDNAYPAGTDQEWQAGLFEVYPNILNKVQTIPTIGNHEMGVSHLDLCTVIKHPVCQKGPMVKLIPGASQSADPDTYDSTGDGPDGTGLPYLDIFTLPTNGELGGVPSGTEQYFSMDYGNVHIVSLDSQLSVIDPDQRQAMRDWLVDDLQSHQQDWTIIVFHHPPYSKGRNHDSDEEQREIDMRELFTPVFEQYGVDVVYSGHAHSYERSWYLNGHYGMSNSFDAAKHTETDSSGSPSFGFSDNPYPQISAVSGKDDKAVYTVAGSSGKIADPEDKAKVCGPNQTVFCIREDWLSHPAHRSFDKVAEDYLPNGIERLGSVLLDVSENQLVSRFIDDKGNVLDHFVITK